MELQDVDSALLYLLQTLRGVVARPIPVSCGARCRRKNAGTKGAAENSLHIWEPGQSAGLLAVDLVPPAGYTAQQFGYLALRCGFPGVGIYRSRNGNRTHVHLDVRSGSVVVWTGDYQTPIRFVVAFSTGEAYDPIKAGASHSFGAL